jgi:hypothetical protein
VILTAVSARLPVIPTWIHFVEMAAVLAVAVWRGGREERLAAGYNLASNSIDLALGVASGFDPRLAAAFGLLDVIFYTAIGLRSARWWTLAAASVALVKCATPLAQLSAHATLWAFGTARLVWFYGLNLVILIGAWTAHRRRAVAAGPARPGALS